MVVDLEDGVNVEDPRYAAARVDAGGFVNFNSWVDVLSLYGES